jgi:apolipoprotein N-acyltransferase
MFLVHKKLSNGWLVALLQTSFWISYEYLHHQWDLAWPWLAVGNAWSNVPELVQYISATGYLGISFWVVLVSALAYQATKTGKKNFSIATAAIGIVFPLLSLVQLQFLNIESDRSVEAVVAQPNYDTYHNYGGYENTFEALDVILNISDSVRTDYTELVVWPESGIRTTIHSEKINNSTANVVKEKLINTAREWNLTLISGSIYYQYFNPGNEPPLSRGSGTNPYLYYNAALGMYAHDNYDVYLKHNLVPIVERIPFIHFLNFADVFDWVSWSDNQMFGKGYKANQFNVAGTKTPALICYDSVFPSWVREFVTGGAGFITIITNDGWWGNTSGHEQHFSYARLRAIEFRRWVVRSANNGISGIINPSGSVKIRTEYWTRTAFRYDVPVLTEQTIYARFGDWLPISMLFVTAGGIILLAFQLLAFQRNDKDKNT